MDTTNEPSLDAILSPSPVTSKIRIRYEPPKTKKMSVVRSAICSWTSTICAVELPGVTKDAKPRLAA
jgi:hypothetical protein